MPKRFELTPNNTTTMRTLQLTATHISQFFNISSHFSHRPFENIKVVKSSDLCKHISLSSQQTYISTSSSHGTTKAREKTNFNFCCGIYCILSQLRLSRHPTKALDCSHKRVLHQFLGSVFEKLVVISQHSSEVC